ncbi:MAG TPA: PVC-type heme-binding CxxCH protein [Candidatus Eisenbacteria bacterium]|nr:PVC-type heme-binding CxxCH protein [Candidatus Eisenbacteria bacterium]
MKVADGFEVKLFASEPEIRQPLTLCFDERGRMWVIQYLQYPTPAGLKAVQVDQYLRTKYDKVPEPPPRGPKGADRVTICEDTDGDGRADKFKDFVTGLNLASGMAIGHGGVFVVQPPYLLFYPDRNHDDVPDGDPEVLLAGFGMEDAHAFANSLQFGPDGWLYGAHGSTVTAHIRGIEFQQGIWRYHPLTKEFELFAEGGGNTWGLDFDADGQIIAGTNFGDVIALHQVQGAYYIKGFSKHGPLHNPYTFGYFDHIPFKGFKGGHVTCGGIVYQGGAFPEKFNGAYIAGNLLANSVYWHALERNGSSFKGHFGGALLETDDITFRPVDCFTGPDGSVFVADWCDKRATHVDSIDTWDRSNGRIYKIEAKGTKPVAKFDLAKMTSAELIGLLGNRNEWFAHEARRILAERRDPSVIPILQKQIFETPDDHLALESLWALYVSGGLRDLLALGTLSHRDANVRAWTVRFLTDSKGQFRLGEKKDPPFFPGGPPDIARTFRRAFDQTRQAIMKRMLDLARTDPSPVVRNQLACTAKRLPNTDALPIIRELLGRYEDVNDPQIPLLIWWAIENKAISDREQVVDLLVSSSDWQRPLVRQFIAERLARRFAAEGTDADFAACASLLASAPGAAEAEVLMKGMEQALAGRQLEKTPAPLEAWLVKAWQPAAPSLSMIRFALRLGFAPAQAPALRLVANDNAAEVDRIAVMEILGQLGQPDSVPVLLAILEKSKSEKLRAAALAALQRFPDPHIAQRLLEFYPTFGADLRNRVRNALCSRSVWARVLVNGVEASRIAPTEVTFDQLRQIVLLNDAPLNQLIEKRWGKVQSESPEEKKNFINELRLVLKPSGAAGRSGAGNALEGKMLFQQACGVCHKFFGEGNTIGPDLTTADRKNTEFLLMNIVNPNAYIRPEYASFELTTKDDEAISGLMVESTPASVTILDRNNQRHVLARAQIKELRESQVSLMPEGLLEALKPQQIMDLFSYLQSNEPPSR